MPLPRLIRARALIIDTNRALVMRRIHDEAVYYTLLGGKVEDDETPEQACVREVLEESGVHIRVVSEAFCVEDVYQGHHNTHHIFTCAYLKGEPRLGGEELDRHTTRNQYKPMWVPVEKLASLDIYPKCVATALQAHLK